MRKRVIEWLKAQEDWAICTMVAAIIVIPAVVVALCFV